MNKLLIALGFTIFGLSINPTVAEERAKLARRQEEATETDVFSTSTAQWCREDVLADALSVYDKGESLPYHADLLRGLERQGPRHHVGERALETRTSLGELAGFCLDGPVGGRHGARLLDLVTAARERSTLAFCERASGPNTREIPWSKNTDLYSLLTQTNIHGFLCVLYEHGPASEVGRE